MIDERLGRLRALMEERGLAAYYVPTDDYHLSEYVCEHFRARAYMTGFTGSAGTLVVTPDEARLWVDSRYFLQSEFQTAGSSVKIMKIGEEGVPTIPQYLADTLPENAALGFDGRTVGAQWALKTGRLLAAKRIRLEPAHDLVGEIWAERPALPKGRVWKLGEEYAGKSAAEKLAHVRRVMQEKDADAHVLASLDDIAWLLNIRGNDIPCCPVALAYLVVEHGEAFLFIDDEKLDGDARDYLDSLNVKALPYDSIYEFAARYGEGSTVLLWSERVNFALYDVLAREAILVDAENPTLLGKAVKNETEVENLRRAHVRDGLALTRFIKWVKENVGKIEMSEISAAEKLDEARRALPGNLGLSFPTICAYGPHAALPHYSATPETDVPIEPAGFLLVDSGGQYYEGTTDVTRTFAMGELSAEQKRNFALVLRGMLALSNARFLYGCRGANLDALCRAPLWEAALDYKHGTGHGVGYLLGVHEGPNSIRWRLEGEKLSSCVLEEGMVTSDEPGLYFEGAYGIRTENLIVCRKDVRNEYGQFMRFETLTCAPIDLDCIDPALLNEAEKKQLNSYHAFVFEKLAPLMDREEREWLRKYTRSV
ncbi:MAG: Aminopeptidase [Firmicutes bacterium ADurb.Bin248]|nr:MAG: Aminopeptidase [Firmicutes bacterium ADurb.Bin248]HPK15721.1 aminopeptidase P family protein [Clostridia bacterium]